MNETKKSYLGWIQIVAWVSVYLLLLFYGMHKWEQWEIVFLTTTIYCIFYLIAIYTQASWIAKNFLKRGSYHQFLVYSLLILLFTTLLRMYIHHVLFFLHFMHIQFYKFTNLSNFSFVLVTQFLASAFGVLLRICLNYITLLKNQEKLKVQHLQTELNFLKSQVQPHFLFNTLNNIYYLAHTKSEKTKDMIAKLSEMMRYFLEEAPKEKVCLSTEIQFLKDYICLEKIRMPYHVQIDFCIRAEKQNVLVPPMLLMPLVENVFKHGLDKAKQHNEAKICLEVDGELSVQTMAGVRTTAEGTAIAMKLRFEVTNDMQNIKYEKQGTGLENLKKRLHLLYGENYVFETRITEGKFVAVLEINL
jgi:sensor histidine kinase YesM